MPGRPEGQRYVIPVRLEDCRIPDRLSKWHAVDLAEASGWAKLLEALDGQAHRVEALVVPHIARPWNAVHGTAAGDNVLHTEIEGLYELDGANHAPIIVRRLLDDRYLIVRDDYACIGLFHGTIYLGVYRERSGDAWGIMRGSLYKRGGLVVHFSNASNARSLRDEVWLCKSPGSRGRRRG